MKLLGSILLMIIGMSIFSCTKTTTPPPVVKTDTIIDTLTDTLIIHDTVKIACKYDTISVTRTLQPTNNPGEVILFGNNSTMDGGSDAYPEVFMSTWTVNGELQYGRTLLRFPYDSIPAGAHITSAKLKLYSTLTPINGDKINANSPNDNSLFIQRVTGAWDSASVKWSTQPSVTDANKVSVPSTTLSFLDINTDVSNLVTDMFGSNNYGFLIRLQNEQLYTSRLFYSSKVADATKHPALVVAYYIVVKKQ